MYNLHSFNKDVPVFLAPFYHAIKYSEDVICEEESREMLQDHQSSPDYWLLM